MPTPVPLRHWFENDSIDWVRRLKFCMKAWFHSLWRLLISDFGFCPCKGQGRHRTHSNSTRCHICYNRAFKSVASPPLAFLGSKLTNLSLLVSIMNKFKATCKKSQHPNSICKLFDKFLHFWLKIEADQICSKFDFSKNFIKILQIWFL